MDTHHPRGSACNRLTAHLTLVYTTLPENHPVHDHVVRQCKEGPTCHENANGIDIPNPPSHVTQPPTPTSNFNHTPSPTRFPSESAEFVVDSASAPSGTHEGEISTRCVAELWRLFVRRFPILSVYRPVWNDRLAAETIRVPLDPQPENATPKKKETGGLGFSDMLWIKPNPANTHRFLGLANYIRRANGSGVTCCTSIIPRSTMGSVECRVG